MRAIAVPRGGSVPTSPVYHETVLADVPPIRLVAVANGGPLTRNGAGFALAVALKPSAANAAVFELETVRLAPSPPCSAITPPVTVDGVPVPVIESIFASKVWTLSVMLSWLPVAPDATKVIGVPLTVMVSPAAKLAASESVPAAPESSVAPVIGAGTVA